MVRQVDSRWNHFEADLRLMHSKLTQLGLAFVNDQVIYRTLDNLPTQQPSNTTQEV